MSAEQSATWRELRRDVVQRLHAAGVVSAEAEARFLVESVSGHDAGECATVADERPPARARARLWPMVERRERGEPLQYVLGAWSFRGLDLMVDRRVLIPRPETEQVVEIALAEAERQGLRRARRRPLVDSDPLATVVDLGTGSGAIALALEAELPDVVVWAVDASEDALAVARANIAGCAATRVRLVQGSWFDPLPRELRGRIALVVSNPPYVAEHDLGTLPPEVADFEPHDALVAGPTGREALEHLIGAAPEWLAEGGALVCEIDPRQAGAVVESARARGYGEVLVLDDLTGRARVLVARAG